jgi:pSer/pThr/pTyr-binding forkhead associated (FHA) protein
MEEGRSRGEECPQDWQVPPGGSIEILRGFYEGLEIPIDRSRLVIGRGKGADVTIAEPTISRSHAAIACQGDVFFVEDLGSTNGTLVNGARSRRAELVNGDEIQMGRLCLRVKLPPRGEA